MIISEIEKNWEQKLVGKIDQMSRNSEIASKYKSSTKYMHYAIKLLLFLWLIIFFQSLYNIIITNID